MIGPKTRNPEDLVEYHRKIVNNLGYFAMSRTRIGTREKKGGGTGATCEYFLESTSVPARIIYWLIYSNTAIKAVFLAFLVKGYFGPLEFLDGICALDYILCVGIVTFGSLIWFLRYPIYGESIIMESFWTVENSIFASLGFPQDLKAVVNRNHYITVWIHLAIVWFGCTILATQFWQDPKYCVWTYSAFEMDNWFLRIIFLLHEFFFMLHPWQNMTGSSSLCAFHGIAFSNLIKHMTKAMEDAKEMSLRKQGRAKRKDVPTTSDVSVQRSRVKPYPVDKLIFDYKQLMLISDLFNEWVSYKLVALHTCGYMQFISDVFVAMQVLKLPGMGIMDVWFYIEDSLASMYVIYRVYTFMSHVKPASIEFMRALNLYIGEASSLERRRLRIVYRSLRIVSLKLGPCPVTPQTVLTALEMLANYYVCVALWN